jgi:hypothetical protein
MENFMVITHKHGVLTIFLGLDSLELILVKISMKFGIMNN